MGKAARLKAIAKTEPIKLDLGCGKNKLAGFTGIDVLPLDGVDRQHDLRVTPWPWEDDSVSEVHSSHFVEHLTWPERVVFFNELWRVMKIDAQARIITPHPSSDSYYGDPTHKEPLSAWYRLYLFKPWREANAPHVQYTCNFDSVDGVGWDGITDLWNDEKKMFGAAHYRNVVRDLHVVLTKKAL
jgi:hypothetical protein